MSDVINDLVRPNIRRLKPYHSARQDFLSGVLLDANENSLGTTAPTDGIALNRYPDPFQRVLRERLALLNGVSPEEIFVGVGSDEVIDLLVRIFCEPGQDNVILAEPTYGMYRVAAEIQNVEVRSVLLTDDFQPDVPALIGAVNDRTKLIFACSPNNPTANTLRRQDILALAGVHAVVVVDEAYWDFSNAPSLVAKIREMPNLVVMRTLSKAWGLAGIRLGYAVADRGIVQWLMKVKPPYNINALTASAALRALDNQKRKDEFVRHILVERAWLSEQLAGIPAVRTVFPSETNFLLVRCTDARRIYATLAQQGIIVRDRSMEPKLENCLRVTVGTHEQNVRLIDAMRTIEP